MFSLIRITTVRNGQVTNWNRSPGSESTGESPDDRHAYDYYDRGGRKSSKNSSGGYVSFPEDGGSPEVPRDKGLAQRKPSRDLSFAYNDDEEFDQSRSFDDYSSHSSHSSHGLDDDGFHTIPVPTMKINVTNRSFNANASDSLAKPPPDLGIKAPNLSHHR